MGQDEKQKEKEQVGKQNTENLIAESAQPNLMGTKESGNEQDSQEKEIPSMKSGGKSANRKEKSQNNNSNDSPSRIHVINSQSKGEEEYSNSSP